MRKIVSLLCAITLPIAQLALPPSVHADDGLEIRYYHPDHLGSTNVVTDKHGQVVQVLEYAPYGQVVTNVTTGSATVAHQFTGQRHDTSTGLYFYKARYYDPHLGRFIQPDTMVQAPGDPQTLNRYAYARNNPVRFVDPTGHSFWDTFKRIWLALITFGQSELMKLNASFLQSFSDWAGINPKYTFAVYSALLGAATGGIGWGLGAAISGGLTALGTSLALDSGEGRELTRKVAKEFFVDVVGMSPQAAYTAASIALSTAISATISLGSQSLRAVYKKFVGYDVTWQKGGPAIPKKDFDPPSPTANNIAIASKNLNPNSVWDQLVKEGGIISRLVNEVPGMNAFAGLHDQLMRQSGMASGLLRPLTNTVLNFPTMPPTLVMTYGALIPPTNVMIAMSSYAASAGQEHEND